MRTFFCEVRRHAVRLEHVDIYFLRRILDIAANDVGGLAGLLFEEHLLHEFAEEEAVLVAILEALMRAVYPSGNIRVKEVQVRREDGIECFRNLSIGCLAH